MTQTILLIIALVVVTLMAISFYWNDWKTKFIIVAMFVFLANTVYFSLDGAKGWPAEEPREVKGILASVVVVNPSDEDAGGIYISLFPTLPQKWYEYVYPRQAPKTYYIEYSNDRAAEFEMAKKAMEEGKEVRINGIPPKTGSGQGEEMLGDPAEQLSNMINGMIQGLVSKERDTYKPKVPDVEILDAPVRPQKGSE